MANIDRIVKVDIALHTTGISKEGFSTILIADMNARSLARVETISSVDDLIELGFKSTDKLYLAASAAFEQTPSPDIVKIGRINPAGVVVKVTAAPSDKYTLTVSSKDASGNITNTPYEYTGGGEIADVLTGLAGVVTADENALVTAAVADNAITVSPKVVGANLKYTVSTNLAISYNAAAETIAEAMTAIVKEDNNFYGVALTDRTASNVLLMADWCEANKKLFGTAVADAGAIDASVTNDLGSQLQAKNYYRTHWWYHALAVSEYPEVAVMARCFSIEPGGETWALKQLAGITADAISETAYNAVAAKSGNTFERFRNITVTQNGKVAADEWIDVIRFRDWLEEEMKVNILNLMINTDKLPYDDSGIGAIESQINSTLELGQRRGGISPDEYDANGNINKGFVVSVPLAADISANNKASRYLQDINFTARLTGAIHVVKVSGSLTYDNLIQVLG